MVKRRIGRCLGSFLLAGIVGCAIVECKASESQKGELAAGIYWDGAATVASRDSWFTGSVNASIGESEESVCQFFFGGRITGKTFGIRTRNFIDTGVVPGTVTLLSDTSFSIKTSENPGCSDRIADFAMDGKTLLLKKRQVLAQIRVVQSAKAYFHSEPDKAKRRKAYLVHGNEARVTETRSAWLKVEFGKTIGWISETDMYPLQ